MSDRIVKWLIAAVVLVLLFALGGVAMLIGMLTARPPQEPTDPALIQTEATGDPVQTEQSVPETQWTPTSIYEQAPEGYFDDALFIGDSRTVGLEIYGNIPGATFLAVSGGGLYSVPYQYVDVAGYGEVTLDELLDHYSFGKIYLMLGVNDLWEDRDSNVQAYRNLLDKILEKQPDAIVYAQANLQVSEAFSAGNSYVNRANVNWFNQQIRMMADNDRVYYLDVNLVFVDYNGYLAPIYTGDGLHLYGEYYEIWAQWIMDHVVIK